jgi:hypothetical protein
MSVVDVEIAEEPIEPGPEPRAQRKAKEPAADEDEPRQRRSSSDVEIEREVTKRQIIESVTSVLVVILYMIFTLVRDRDTGVVVIDPDDRDDWAE